MKRTNLSLMGIGSAIILLCVLFFSGCKNEKFVPKATGLPYEVLVVLDKATWEGPAGRALFDILDTDVPCLPQSERSFRIMQVAPKDFNQTFRIIRNIIQVNIDNTQFTRTGMRFMRDKYAVDQIVLTINSPSLEDFQQFCTDHKQEVIDFLTRSEMNRLIKELEKKHSKITYDLAWQIFACHLYAPKELTSYKKGDYFLWTSGNFTSILKCLSLAPAFS